MSRPRLLDLFCCEGGAAMGYHRAGYDVVGVDIVPRKRYPFTFIQADALTFPLDGFDALHASPPCQEYSALKVFTTHEYGRHIEPIRERLAASGVPYVIENVPGAPLDNYVLLCGTMFGLQLKRHRKFESNYLIFPPCQCQHTGDEYNYAHASAKGRRLDHHYHGPLGMGDLMGVEWMSKAGMKEAIPPAYTEYIGQQLLTAMEMAE